VSATLHARFAASVARFPDRLAVSDPATGRRLTYAELDAAARELAAVLIEHGTQPGDRIGVSVPKSIDSVIAILAILRTEAAYVPVDAGSPVARNAFVFQDCQVRYVVAAADTPLATHDGFEIASDLGGSLRLLRVAAGPGTATPGLAYVLYTSGSTGHPKGVMLTHANALSFVDWCAREFATTEHDRFSSHAPFHFDLSILDLYVPLAHGAQIVLLNETLGKSPATLVRALAEERLTCWYSTPSILRLMLEMGGLAAGAFPDLRLLLFAGEVYPVASLNALRRALPGPRYYNLYGPTETNVCTYYRLPDAIEEGRTLPYPIGWCCENDEARVVRADGSRTAVDEEGELLIRGGTVMQGYWNQPDRTQAAFLEDPDGRWYRTGDLVRRLPEDPACYVYVGRRDRMVKRRGYRVELGEIEGAFHRLDGVREAATIALADVEAGVHICLFYSWNPEAGAPPSSLKLRQHAARHLPPYMIPDAFHRVDALPMTSTDKIDYQSLLQLAQAP